jgi:hypothetical protein
VEGDADESVRGQAESFRESVGLVKQQASVAISISAAFSYSIRKKDKPTQGKR